MEIRVERHVTPERLREEILRRYGSLEVLEQIAAAGSREAEVDLVTFRHVDREEPGGMYTISTILELEPDELEALTPQRMRLLTHIRRTRSPMGVSDLAEHLARDKKNVSEDLAALSRMGLVTMERQGRKKIARPLGDEIHIIFDDPDASSASA